MGEIMHERSLDGRECGSVLVLCWVKGDKK